MAEDEEFTEEVDFEEDLAEADVDPDELDEEDLAEEGFELDEEDDEAGIELDEDAVEEEEDEAPAAAAPRRAASDEDDEDEDLVDPDDVEADLDTILKDRLVAADEGNEDEEDDEPEDRTETGDRLQPKRADEQLCSSCFLLVRQGAPVCPVGDDDCPIFSS